MSRRSMLELLRAHPDGYISGEQVSEQLGLSRTAIWKSVDALRKSGYTIEARTGLGYRLTASPDVLTEEELRWRLADVRTVGRTLVCLDEVDSTNSYAKKLGIGGGADGTVVVANSQTAGRGRMERKFQSPPDRGIYLTALLRPALPPEKLLSITGLCATAISNAIEQTTGTRPGIKWTNDLVLHGKKVCGILTEMSLEGESGRLQYLVMGIGVNVSQTSDEFSPEVRTMASSLSQELGVPVSRPALAAAEIAELDKLYAALLTGETEEYLMRYRESCVTLGREVQLLRADGSREHVRALDIDDQFGLVVRRDSGETAVIRSGEASVRGMYGYVE
jgi:BirA family biotin operon repressor/biotin-[acetyl-CoA-carboxylase] ligase